MLSHSLKLEEKTKSKEDKFKKEAEDKKALKQAKKEENQKKKDEKQKKQKIKKEEKLKTIVEKIDENEMGAMDDLFDVLQEASKQLDNSLDNSTLVKLDNIKLYESPLPFQRHIDAIKDCEPNSLISKTLINGSKTLGDSYIKLIHGPPGTGKTYNLINELNNMLESSKHKKILICAPSNIATINLYERALKEDIDCSIIISNKGKQKNNKYSSDEIDKRLSKLEEN